MKRPLSGGFLVAVEGIDGAGKTTIATLLAQWCGERGLACTISKEPTGLAWGQILRASAKEGRLKLEDEIELFALDRKDHVARSINPALAENHIVILDRYYWSTAAYQGARGADARQIVQDNESFAPKPNLVLLLDVEASIGLERITKRGDEPNAFEKIDALNKSREIFLRLASEEDAAIVIDASGSLRQTHAKALKSFEIAALNQISRQDFSPTGVDLVLEFLGEERIAKSDDSKIGASV